MAPIGDDLSRDRIERVAETGYRRAEDDHAWRVAELCVVHDAALTRCSIRGSGLAQCDDGREEPVAFTEQSRWIDYAVV